MDETQTCPRRMYECGPWKQVEGLDRWSAPHGIIGQDRIGLSCSFCGSLHPDRFMQLVREGWIVGPTDKSYKVYLESPLPDDVKAERRERWMTTDRVAKAIRDVGERDGKTPEDIQADLDIQWQRVAEYQLHGNQTAKFYFQHLSENQRDEFIDLLNTSRMNIGYPGRFYVTPFFAQIRA